MKKGSFIIFGLDIYEVILVGGLSISLQAKEYHYQRQPFRLKLSPSIEWCLSTLSEYDLSNKLEKDFILFISYKKFQYIKRRNFHLVYDFNW